MWNRKLLDKKLKERRNRIILDYKRNKQCGLCGWKEHPEILQFHHTKDNKEIGISSRYGFQKIKKEIKKCILLCPNCHYWYHYTRWLDYDK